jgi:hypothetical protein
MASDPAAFVLAQEGRPVGYTGLHGRDLHWSARSATRFGAKIMWRSDGDGVATG